MEAPTQWIAAGGVVGLMVINISFVLALLRSYQTRQGDQQKDLDGQRDEIRQLQRQNFVCEQRTNILVWTLQKNNIEVPEMIWNLDERPQT